MIQLLQTTPMLDWQSLRNCVEYCMLLTAIFTLHLQLCAVVRKYECFQHLRACHKPENKTNYRILQLCNVQYAAKLRTIGFETSVYK